MAGTCILFLVFKCGKCFGYKCIHDVSEFNIYLSTSFAAICINKVELVSMIFLNDVQLYANDWENKANDL